MGVSGRQPLSNAPTMAHAGITAILNLTIKPDPKWSFVTMNDGEPDDGLPKPPEWFHRGLNFFRSASKHGRVLIHCEAGVNRSPSMAYFSLRSEGLPAQEALHKLGTDRVRYQDDAERALA